MNFNIITELPTITQEFVARWIGHDIIDFELWKIIWPQNSTIIPIDYKYITLYYVYYDFTLFFSPLQCLPKISHLEIFPKNT